MKVWVSYRSDGYEGNAVLGLSHTLSTALDICQSDANNPPQWSNDFGGMKWLARVRPGKQTVIEWERPDTDNFVEGWTGDGAFHAHTKFFCSRVEVKM